MTGLAPTSGVWVRFRLMARHLPLVFSLLVSVVATAWRLVDVAEWPSPFHPTIQYESALAARAIWQASDPDARMPWFEAVGFAHVVSPPVLPALVAGVYLLTGEESPWASKLFATAFWLAAGWFVRATAIRTTGSRRAATLAFAWFVLTPFGVKLSRSFQTEPVLVCAFAAAVWVLARLDRPGWRATLLAGAACGAAAFVKPGVLFSPLVAGFAGVVFSAPVPNRFAKLAVFAALTVLPSLGYAALVLDGHVGNKVMPELLATWWYYGSVEKQVAAVVGYGALGLAAGGVAFAATRRELLLPGLFAGYAAYLAVFTFHCATHDYYHAPLLVLVAVAMAGPLARLEARWAPSQPSSPPPLRGRSANEVSRVGGITESQNPPPEPLRGSTSPTRGEANAAAGGMWTLAVALVLLAAYLLVTKNPHLGPWRWTPSARADLARRADEQSRRVAAYRAVRDAVGPGAGVVVLGDAFGYPLEYHAGVRRAFWPRPADVPVLIRGGQLPEGFTAEGYLRELVKRRGFDYFAVTDLAALDEQPGLRHLLDRCGRLIAFGPELRLYDLRPMRVGGPW